MTTKKSPGTRIPKLEQRRPLSRRNFLSISVRRTVRIGGIGAIVFSMFPEKAEATYCPTDSHTCSIHTCTPGPTHLCGPDTCELLDECVSGRNNLCNSGDICQLVDNCQGVDACSGQDVCDATDTCNKDRCSMTDTCQVHTCTGLHKCYTHDACFSHYCSGDDVCFTFHSCATDNCLWGNHDCQGEDVCGTAWPISFDWD